MRAILFLTLTLIPEDPIMTDTTGAAGPWAEAWLETQKRYWDAWTEWSRHAGQGFAPQQADNPWARATEMWWKAAAPALPQQGREAYERLFQMGKSYMHMGEALWKTFDQARASGGQDWQQALRAALDSFKHGFARAGTPDPWSGFATFWGLPSDTWRQVVSSFSMLPGDFEKTFRAGAAGDPVYSALDRMLSLPSFGYTREWQEQMQEWGLLYVDYGRSLQNFGDLLNKSTGRAVDILVKKLTAQASKGEAPDSLRAMYDLWIDCGEEAFAELANSEEFSTAQAEMTNALMKLKRHEQLVIEETLASLNMPTRTELNTALCRQHELRRELRHIRRQLEEITPEAVSDRVADIKAQIEDVKTELGALQDSAGSPAKKRSPAKKKAAGPDRKAEV
jgi:class III poly(R)-hydroxyalkanoic acid synthase PhaE subunit